MRKFKLIIAFAMLFVVAAMDAQTTDKTKKPTIIFAHGLFADGSSWSEVIPPLLDAGYDVISVQNPTSSLAEDVAYTKRAIARTNGPIVLVGHSWAGFVITEAGNDPKVKALVYVAAYAPDKGETLPGLNATSGPIELGNYFVKNAGFITLSKEGVQKAFAADVTAKQQGVIYATQNAASENVFNDSVTEAAWKTKPSWYIVAKNDKAINPDLERFMAKRAKSTTLEVESSHVAMIAKPKQVLEMILQAAKQK